MRLIINADDFALTKGVTDGIIKAYKEGILTSTTMMVNMPYIDLAKKYSDENPGLAVGIHLVLTAGKPILNDVKTIVDENGDFYKYKYIYNKEIYMDPKEVYREWKAQIEKFIKVMGRKPTHIDSHHHAHLMWPGLEIIQDLANEYNIPIRQEEYMIKDYEFVKFIRNFHEENINIEYFYEDKDSMLNYDIVELMCHPGIVDKELRDKSSYTDAREKELKILLSKELKNWIIDNNIELINYTDISRK